MNIHPSTYFGLGRPYKLNTKGSMQGVGKEAIEYSLEQDRKFLKTDIRIYHNNQTPTKEIDFEYNSEEELLEQISKRYDMEKMEPWDLAQVLGMLKQGGVISSEEYWLGQSVIPIMGSTSDAPRPKEFENALTDYYSNFETYVENSAHLYPPQQAQRLRDSMLVHKKMEGIFKEIQSYR